MPQPKPAYTLSLLIAMLAALASAGGLLLKDLYRDNLFVTSAWKGNDIITLFVAVPILVAAMIFARRGSLKAQLVWMGALDYMLYNYAFYLFGAAFNWFFLLYVVLLGLSIFALILGLIDLDVNGISQQVRARTPVKWIAAYMSFVAVGLTVIYVSQSLGFIFTGEVPAIVERTGHPTSVVFALDLTLLVPFLALGAIWILGRKPWGFVLAGISTVKGPLYTLVLTAGSLWAANAGVEGAGGEVPLWVTLTALGLIACGLFYGNLKSKE
ncbi:MAG TPA: hypothetical protein VI451_12310 [Anaerolineales bacterium]|nr:hypothetical protein [Anaerolineales bacterium]